MSRNQRILIIVGALVAVVVAFIVLQPSDDDDDSDSTTATVTRTVTEQATTPTETVEQPPATTTAAAEPPEAEAVEIEIEGGQPKGGVQELTFKRGDRIRLRFRSDTADEIHVHGYDITRALPANRDVAITIDAKLEGVFEVELHGSGTQIAELTVEP